MILQPPEHSGINMTWTELLELPVLQRNMLAEMLDERRGKENDAYRKTSGR